LNDHVKGILITAIGVLLVVPDSLFVRLIYAEPIVIAFWRSLTSGIFVLIIVIYFYGLSGFKDIINTGFYGLFYGILIASTAPAFVLAVSNTSVANVVFIFASMPVFAAIFSRIFLGEPIKILLVITMGVVAVGLFFIAYGSTKVQIASWNGDIWAIYVSAAFAAALTLVRSAKIVSMVPAIPFAYLGGALVLSFFISPLEVRSQDWNLILMHGTLIGASSCLLTLGPRFISSSEVALLILLESVLAPILVWLILGEHPGQYAIIGGFIIISALCFFNLYNLSKLPRR
jgi:drug/metabolite transporter (DMT)-like permease